MIPTSIDGTDITGATIDGTDVTEITVDGQTVFTSGQLFTDIANFESGSLDPSFVGARGEYVVNNSAPTLTGTFSLKKTVPGEGLIHSQSGLTAYPNTNQRFACYARGDSVPSVHWATQSNGDSYGFGFIPGDNVLLLAKYEPRNEFTPRVSVSLQSNEWYDLEIEWKSNGDITGRIFDVDQSTGVRQGSALASISGNDTTYTSGGIGFDTISSHGNSEYDNYRILEDI